MLTVVDGSLNLGICFTIFYHEEHIGSTWQYSNEMVIRKIYVKGIFLGK